MAVASSSGSGRFGFRFSLGFGLWLYGLGRLRFGIERVLDLLAGLLQGLDGFLHRLRNLDGLVERRCGSNRGSRSHCRRRRCLGAAAAEFRNGCGRGFGSRRVGGFDADHGLRLLLERIDDAAEPEVQKPADQQDRCHPEIDAPRDDGRRRYEDHEAQRNSCRDQQDAGNPHQFRHHTLLGQNRIARSCSALIKTAVMVNIPSMSFDGNR